jgi:hypothetical protein
MSSGCVIVNILQLIFIFLLFIEVARTAAFQNILYAAVFLISDFF